MLFPTFVSIIKNLFKHPKESLIIILLLTTVSLGYMYRQRGDKIRYLKSYSDRLDDKLKAKVSLGNDGISIYYRDENGNTRRNDIYVPPEGRADVLDPKDGENTPDLRGLDRLTHDKYDVPGSSMSIVVKIAGFAFKPGFGAFYDGEGIKGEIDLKIVYWRRFSGILWAGTEYGGVAISRHIDDFFPKKIAPRNVEIAIFGGLEYNNPENKVLFLGFRSNF